MWLLFIIPLVKWNVNFLVLGRKEISRPYKPFKFNCFKQIWSSSFLFSFYYNAFYTWIMWGWDKDAAALSGSHFTAYDTAANSIKKEIGK